MVLMAFSFSCLVMTGFRTAEEPSEKSDIENICMETNLVSVSLDASFGLECPYRSQDTIYIDKTIEKVSTVESEVITKQVAIKSGYLDPMWLDNEGYILVWQEINSYHNTVTSTYINCSLNKELKVMPMQNALYRIVKKEANSKTYLYRVNC